MKNDILTVMWKEKKGLFRIRGRRAQALLGMFSPVLLAVLLPLQEGVGWVQSPLSLLLAFVAPLILVGISIPDSFAGERERHTLPTLLASRLSDRAILFGKMITSVAFGWGVTLVLLAIGLVTVNVANWDGHILFYKPSIILADLALGFLVAMLTAGAGVLFSLRAATAQEAQQTLMAVLLIPPMILQFVVFAIMGSDSGKARLQEVLGTLSFERIILVIVVVLLVLDAVLLMAAMSRFKRARPVFGLRTVGVTVMLTAKSRERPRCLSKSRITRKLFSICATMRKNLHVVIVGRLHDDPSSVIASPNRYRLGELWQMKFVAMLRRKRSRQPNRIPTPRTLA